MGRERIGTGGFPELGHWACEGKVHWRNLGRNESKRGPPELFDALPTTLPFGEGSEIHTRSTLLTLLPPTLDDAADARAFLADRVHRTPTVASHSLSEMIGAPLFLKCENLQRTGAFKVRGALWCLAGLDPDARARGVVTISAGNHAQAVAWAAREMEVEATVVMPHGASPIKITASEGYGARVIVHGSAKEAFARAHALAEDEGFTFVHPFDDPRVIAGHASVGFEILEQCPEVATIVVPVGGGGLISGIAVACLDSNVRIIGVEPEGADAMCRSLEAGRPVHLDAVSSIADGLAAPMAGALNFDIVRQRVHDVVRVSDEEIAEAMGVILNRTKMVVEPAAAAGVAALLSGKVSKADGPVLALLSGGNVDLARIADLIGERR